jgi:shikimate dehydrogenase
MRLFGLIGFPLTHSFSSKYFSEKFEKENIKDCRYHLFPIPAIGELPALLAAHADLHGLNVTIPYKKLVLPYLHSSEHIPTGLEACNCIRIDNGKLYGYNTDVMGFENSFTPLLQSHHTRALVLGNGGATAAVTHVLNKLGIPFDIVSRQLHPGSTLTYSDLTPEIMARTPVIINTTPLGMYPSVNECPDIPYAFISDQHYLYDIVYNPGKTLFLQHGEQRGAMIRNGADMLIIQAEESWKIWNA